MTTRRIRFAGVLLLSLLVSIVAISPHFRIGEAGRKGWRGGTMPVSHDGMMHLNQMQSFWRGLSSGLVYPRWDEMTHQGYGAPVTIFYPPGTYYLTSLLFALLGDWMRVIKIANLTLLVLSGLAIYLYARRYLGVAASLVSMALYVVAPYHLINIYQRGALAELTGFIWLPLTLLFAERLGSDRGESHEWPIPDFAGLAVCFGAFLYCHPPTAYQTLLIFSPLMVAERLARRRRSGEGAGLRGMALIAGGLLWGMLLAAAYFFPAWLERGLINSDDVAKTWPYHASYVFDYAQQHYDRSADPFPGRIDAIWLFNSVAVAAAGVTLWLTSRRQRTSDGQHGGVRLWLAAGALASLMMTSPSAVVGRLIPGIEIGVFSWRMLTISSLTTALAVGACLDRRCGSAWRRHCAVGVATIIFCGALFTCYQYVVRPMYDAPAFIPQPTHFNLSLLPVGVPVKLPESEPASLVAGKGSVSVLDWQPEYRRLRLDLTTQATLRVRTSYFPGWTALLNEEVSAIEVGPLGEIRLNLPAGQHDLKLTFSATPVRFRSSLISIGAIILLLLLTAARGVLACRLG